MGVLDPLCAARGPENTIYSLSSGSSYGNSTTNPGGQYYIVAKSNAPTAFTDITWHTIATISSNALGVFDSASACIVDGHGVFTIFGYGRDSKVAGINPLVVRYDPSKNSTESTGPGGWMNIAVSESYKWSAMSTTKSLAFYVKDTTAGGAQKLIHLTSGSIPGDILQFGTVDETTKTLSHAANWTLGGLSFPKVKAVAYGNNELYVYWTPDVQATRLLAYPLASLTSTIPPNPRRLDTNATTDICLDSSHVSSALWDNSLYLLCAFNNRVARYDTTLYSINNITQNGSSASAGITIPNSLDQISFFIPMAATPDYAFMLDTGNSYPGAYALELSGANTGSVQGPKDIIVPEAFGKDPNATPTPTPTPTPTNTNTNSSSDSDKTSTGAIIGVVIGFLVVVVITVYCYRKQSSHSNNEKKHATKTTANQVYNGRHNPTEVKGQETPHIVEPAVMPMTQVAEMNGPYQMNRVSQPHLAGAYPQMPGQPMYPISQPAPIAISDARTITPAATVVPSFQSGQDHIQYLQFSSHPRPNFITTVGDNG